MIPVTRRSLSASGASGALLEREREKEGGEESEEHLEGQED